MRERQTSYQLQTAEEDQHAPSRAAAHLLLSEDEDEDKEEGEVHYEEVKS